MDELDLKIVDILQHDSRASKAGIARRVGVSEGTVRRRLNRLVGENLIEFRVTAGASGRERRSQSVVGIQVDPAKLDSVLQQVSEFDQVMFAASTTGAYDLLAWVGVESLDDLGRFLIKSVGKIPGVRRTETHVVLTVGKEVSVN
jgi:Lrp/AsnC family transcriptional regulator for asnA, asnC and gidA